MNEAGQVVKSDDIVLLRQQFVTTNKQKSEKKSGAKPDVSKELDQVEAEAETD